jgi:hypothetical protein
MISNIFKHILGLFSFLGPRKPLEYKGPEEDKKAIQSDFEQVAKDLGLAKEDFLDKYK